MVAGGALYAQSMVSGFAAHATYWEGARPTIQVSVSHSLAEDRVVQVELIRPEGGSVPASRLNTETVTETRTVTGDGSGAYSGGGVGFGFGTGGYSGGGVGVGFAIPLFGGGRATTTETITKEVRTEAEIEVPDVRDYRINWSFYKIRIEVARADGRIESAVIGAPRP